MGPLPVLLYPLRTGVLRRPLLRLPGDEIAVLFDVLRTSRPDPASIAEQLDANRVLFERNRAVGGTLYPIGAIPLSVRIGASTSVRPGRILRGRKRTSIQTASWAAEPPFGDA